jgi:hypothetical protein
MADDDIEEYDSTKTYKLGDKVRSHINPEYIAPVGGEYHLNLYTFVLRRESNFQQSPVSQYYFQRFPDDPRYEEYIKQFDWELVWPEWSASGKYGEGSLVIYNGRYYFGTPRMYFNFENESSPPRRLPNEPPDVLVDEEDVRAWTICSINEYYPTYALVPYHLERMLNYDDESTQEDEHAPYWYSIQNYSWKNGVRFPGYMDGYSISVYQGSPAYGSAPNQTPVVPPSSELVCGVALQSLQLGGIYHNCTIASLGLKKGVEPPEGGSVKPWRYSGDITPSPDYNNWYNAETGEVIPPFDQGYNAQDNDCSTMQRGTPGTISTDKDSAVGEIYYTHNHPLYFNRKVEVIAGTSSVRYYWKFFPQTSRWTRIDENGLPTPAPCYWYWGNYIRLTEKGTQYEAKTGTFSPKEDCWSVTHLQQYPKLNSIGTFTLETGDDVVSQQSSYSGPPRIEYLEAKVETN